MKKAVERNSGDIAVLEAMKFEWLRRGDPIKARDIQRAIDGGYEADKSCIIASMIPEGAAAKDILSVKHPPRAGKGSGAEEWRDFLFDNSDMDEEAINAMSRDDIIAHCENVGLIEKEEN